MISLIVETTLKEVAEVIYEMSTRQLYGITPFEVHEHFINQFVRKWETICLACFRDVERILRQFLISVVQKHFGRFHSSGLLTKVQ